MSTLVSIPKPIPNLRPLICRCEHCKDITPQFIYTRSGGPSVSPLLIGAIAAAVTERKIVLICYDCFNMTDTKKKESEFLNLLKLNKSYNYIFAGNVPVYDKAREAISHVLKAASIQESYRLSKYINKNVIESEIETAMNIKRANQTRFTDAITADLKRMANTLPKKCPRCAEEVRTEARICKFCGYKFE